MENTKLDRIRAYQFVKHLFSSGVNLGDINGRNFDLTNDVELADVLNVNLSNLTLLKEGTIDPSPQLVKSIRCFFRKSQDPTLFTQIDHILIAPFRKN